ncbi:hypothetical protein SAMN05444385_11428 [Tritonibacter mobilis]|nr:hypothetical protein SAMN05444385_11428 [Tritonibacter mobilis]
MRGGREAANRCGCTTIPTNAKSRHSSTEYTAVRAEAERCLEPTRTVRHVGAKVWAAKRWSAMRTIVSGEMFGLLGDAVGTEIQVKAATSAACAASLVRHRRSGCVHCAKGRLSPRICLSPSSPPDPNTQVVLCYALFPRRDISCLKPKKVRIYVFVFFSAYNNAVCGVPHYWALPFYCIISQIMKGGANGST